MPLARTAVIDGPGSLTFGSLKLHAKDQMSAEVEIDSWRPDISTFGQGAPRLRDARGKITLTPTGNITAAMLTALFPTALRSPTIGASMHGAADVAAALHSVAGTVVTFPNAALAGLPELTLSPQGTALGQVTLNALIANGVERTDTGAFYTTSSAAWTETFLDAEIIAVPYTGVWNSVTFYTEDGWKVSFDLQLTPRYVDGIGTIDYTVGGLTVRASCKPVNLTEANLLAYQRPEGLALGSTMRMSKNLVITGATGGLIVTLYDAVMLKGPCQWGKTTLRAGEIGFEASRQITGGTLGPLFAISIA
jgi:hypothetical protein